MSKGAVLPEIREARAAGVLHIADDVALPLEAATDTMAILAKKGAGKTYTAAVLAEELLAQGVQTVVVDPTGAWWGLRAGADGSPNGLPIVIFGGEHADVALDPGMGDAVAALLVEQHVSAIIDLSLFRKGEAIAFMTAFAETLYHRNRKALALIVDEADSYAPQSARPEQMRLLGAIEDIVRRGRIRGLGTVLITQRPAVLNKNVLTQVDTLIVLQMTAPQDRKAIDEWVAQNADQAQRDIVMASLPNLGKGEAWIWSPTSLGLFERLQIRVRRTFNSSATPKVGESISVPSLLAPVAIAEIRDTLAAAATSAVKSKTAKSETSVTALRARIADLERELQTRGEQLVEVPAIADDQIAALQRSCESLVAGIRAAEEVAAPIVAALERVAAAKSAVATVVHQRAPRDREARSAKVAPPASSTARKSASTREEPAVDDAAGGLKKGARKMLGALAHHHPVRVTRAQLGTLAKISASGGTFQSYLSALKRGGYFEEAGGLLSITPAGLKFLGAQIRAVPKTQAEVLQIWRGALKAGARAMLDELVRVHPKTITRSELGDRVKITTSGGTFGSYLSTLRRNGLVDVNGEDLRAGAAAFARVRR